VLRTGGESRLDVCRRHFPGLWERPVGRGVADGAEERLGTRGREDGEHPERLRSDDSESVLLPAGDVASLAWPEVADLLNVECYFLADDVEHLRRLMGVEAVLEPLGCEHADDSELASRVRRRRR
jgi:hypothetical protein